MLWPWLGAANAFRSTATTRVHHASRRGAAVSSWISPLQALAQALDNVPRRIGFVSGASYTATAKNVAAFLEGMRAHSYVEGRDFEMDYRWAEGHLARVSTLVEELVGSKPDLILATIVQAAVAAVMPLKPSRFLPIARRSRTLGFDSRIEPPMSLACATGTIPAATAAAAPPLDPAVERVVSHGFRHAPKAID